MTRHRLSIRKRLERLEAAFPKPMATDRTAFIVIGDFAGERHLVVTSSTAWECWFQEVPGPGPQLADFGEFAVVGIYPSDEARS